MNKAKVFGTRDRSDGCAPFVIIEYDPPVESISLPKCKEVASNWSGYINPTITPPSARNKTVYWTSSNTNVAAVNYNTGLICARGFGSTVITARTADGSKYATCTVTVKNLRFNTAYTASLKNSSNSLVGSGVRRIGCHYTPAQCIDIILSYDSHITNLCNRSGYYMPKAFVQSLLMRELWCVGVDDDVADLLVSSYYGYRIELEWWYSLPWYEQLVIPRPEAPIPYRDDSSTGIGQMFAATGISAHNNARDIGLHSSAYISTDRWNDWNDWRTLWHGLKDDNNFNIKMVYYEIFNCARKSSESGYGYITQNDLYKFSQFSERQIQSVFSFYNGDASYGEDVLEYYRIFSQYNNY